MSGSLINNTVTDWICFSLGAIFGAIASAETTVNVISSVTSQSIYLATVKVMRWFTFLLFAGFNGVSLLLLM